MICLRLPIVRFPPFSFDNRS